jgi:Na+-driven multidrug efflux pump
VPVSLEIRRTHPVRAANIGAVVYFILFALFAVPMAFFFSGDMAQRPGIDPAQQEEAARAMRWMMLGYPIVGAVFGWIGAAVGAAVYNLVAPRLGGLLLEVCETPRVPGVGA